RERRLRAPARAAPGLALRARRRAHGLGAGRRQRTGRGVSASVPIEAAAVRLSVAPMMDWTDPHCRVFHRIVAPHARLYTEMVHANAGPHGHRAQLPAP